MRPYEVQGGGQDFARAAPFRTAIRVDERVPHTRRASTDQWASIRRADRLALAGGWRAGNAPHWGQPEPGKRPSSGIGRCGDPPVNGGWRALRECRQRRHLVGEDDPDDTLAPRLIAPRRDATTFFVGGVDESGALATLTLPRT